MERGIACRDLREDPAETSMNRYATATASAFVLMGLLVQIFSSASRAVAEPTDKTIDDLLSETLPPPRDAGPTIGDPAPAMRATEAPASLAPVSIKWRVDNPFRFFADPADTEVHRATYRALSPDELRRPILSAERALAVRHEDGWAETMYRKTCWDTSHNRHVCPDKGDYMNPKSHGVVAVIDGIADKGVDCTWLTAPHGGDIPRGIAVKQPCTEPRSARCSLSKRPWRHRRGRRPRGGEHGDCRARHPGRRHGRQLRRRRGKPGCSRALFARARRRLRQSRRIERAGRLSSARRTMEEYRRQGLHRRQRALARSGLPPLALLLRAARRPRAGARGPAPCSDLCRLRLLGRRGHVGSLPSLQG